VNSDCRSFRRTLQRALEESRAAEELNSLSWHEHLLGCGDCRALLEAEEALETLLESLPKPHLPPQLAQRVLARLRRGAETREAALDRLLDLDRQAGAPDDLARRVLAGLQSERAQPADARLDALLERARAVDVPADLAQRVLAHVAEERQLARRRKPVLARSSFWFAAAAGLLLLAAWAFWPPRTVPREVAQAPEPADPRMLEHIEVLEQWEFLRRNDLDTLLSTLPQRDQLLIEMGSEEGLLGG
jgi:hypothetical protein